MNYLRKILIIIFSITVSTLLAQAPWTRITPTPQENTINDITRIPGTDRLVAVCDGSTIMMSDDAGETWDLILNPAGRNNQNVCKGIHFISETTGFINGDRETILKTTDGGQTWDLKYQGSTIYEWQCINDIEFLNNTHGFAVGDYGQLFETTDAGETWNPVTTSAATSLQRIVFADSLTGFIFTWSTECLKTTDGGITWTYGVLSDELPQGQLFDCYFTNATTGFVFIYENSPDNKGYIFITTDAGLTWTQVFSDYSAYTGKFAFFNGQQGMIACGTWDYLTKILLTNDGGLSWSEISHPWVPWGAANSMIYTNQLNAIMLGYKGMIYKTNDGGLSWQPKQNRLFSGEIFEAQFLNEDTGYTLNDAGSGGVGGIGIKKTIDGGNNWNIIYENFWSYDLDFCFLTTDTGFGVTKGFNDSISVIKTTDGGGNWSEISTSFEFTPTDIKFIDENNGIICGEYLVIRTSDGGLTWQEVTPGSGWNAFNEIEYRSSNEVFIAGSESYQTTSVSVSTDGGLTWQTFSPGDYRPAVDIVLPDEHTIVITTGLEIFKSSDNGLTWNQSTLANPNTIDIKSLHFTSPITGYAMGSGEFANMMKSTDGGDTWFLLETRETSGLNAACFFNDEEGLVFGDKGVIIRTTTGGVTGTHDQAITDTDSYFTASPNPFSDEIIFRPIDGNKVIYPVQVVLMDASGRQIMEKRITCEGNDIRISGIGLKPGIYICRISSRNGVTETLKLINIR
jgi:photosystem II stability/assembly factor-like uncharacterized protein